MSPAGPRVRPAFRWLLAGFLSILIPYAAWSSWDYMEARRLSQAIDSVRAHGGFTRDVTRLPEAANDAMRYYLAAGALTTSPDNMSVVWRQLRDRTSPVSPDILAQAQAELDASAPVFALVDHAVAAPAHPWRLDSSGDTRALYRLSQLLAFRTIVLARQGQREAAGHSLLQQIDLARAFDEGRAGMALPWGLDRSNVLSTAAPELGIVLSDAPPPPDTLERLSDAYRVDVPEDLQRTIAWQQDALLASARFGSQTVDRLARPLFRQKLARDLEVRLAMLDGLASLPAAWPAKMDWARQQVAAEPDALRPYATLLVTIQGAAAAVAAQRTARVAIAAARFRGAHGTFPAAVEDLVPAWLDVVPLDPFDGKPLRWRATNSDFTVYSVGMNGVDDGGNLTQFTIAVGAPGHSPDIGIHVTAP